MRKSIFLYVSVLSLLFLTMSVASPKPGSTAASGTQRWILSVKPGFRPADVTALGGTCLWYWKGAGIAAVDSANPNFGDLANGGTIDFAVADMAAKPPRRLSIPKITGLPPLDAYASGYQWYWQAIGAVRYDATNQPVWQLGDYTGSGVKIADIDTGAPSVWLAYDAEGNPTAFDLHPEFNEYDPLHPDLGGVVLLRDGGGNVLNYDDGGHGTAVCATIGTQHRGEGAMRGLAPQATLYCHKIDENNWMSSCLEGWFKAAEFGCQILNNSWYDVELPAKPTPGWENKLPLIYRKAATELGRRGVLIVAAASNDAIDPNKDGGTYYPFWWGKWASNEGWAATKLIPQDMPHVIIAGGTGPADYDPLAYNLSQYDPLPGGQKGRAFNLDRSVNCYIPPDSGGPWWIGSDYGAFLTVVAPMGYNIKDWTMPVRNLLYQLMYLATPWEGLPGEGLHDYWAGTSFSSPITCGVAALAAEAYFRVHGVMPSPTTLASIIKASADDKVGPATDDFWVWNGKALQFEFQTNVKADKPAKDERYGYGRVNVKRAIELAQK
jgi:Subtilase family